MDAERLPFHLIIAHVIDGVEENGLKSTRECVATLRALSEVDRKMRGDVRAFGTEALAVTAATRTPDILRDASAMLRMDLRLSTDADVSRALTAWGDAPPRPYALSPEWRLRLRAILRVATGSRADLMVVRMAAVRERRTFLRGVDARRAYGLTVGEMAWMPRYAGDRVHEADVKDAAAAKHGDLAGLAAWQVKRAASRAARAARAERRRQRIERGQQLVVEAMHEQAALDGGAAQAEEDESHHAVPAG